MILPVFMYGSVSEYCAGLFQDKQCKQRIPASMYHEGTVIPDQALITIDGEYLCNAPIGTNEYEFDILRIQNRQCASYKPVHTDVVETHGSIVLLENTDNRVLEQYLFMLDLRLRCIHAALWRIIVRAYTDRGFMPAWTWVANPFALQQSKVSENITKSA